LGGKIVAVKIPRNIADGARMKQEAKFGAGVNERTMHVMQIYGLKQEGGLVYMVCEFLDGEAAVEVLEKKEPVPVTPLARVLRKILEMADAHSSGYAMDEVPTGATRQQAQAE
jgi:hypothetical protein